MIFRGKLIFKKPNRKQNNKTQKNNKIIIIIIIIIIYIYIYLIKVANLAVECSMSYRQNVV